MGLYVVEEVAPDIEIARSQCRYCGCGNYADPNTLPDHLLESMKDD
jgi:hypothetical protein